LVREARGGTVCWGTANRQQQPPAFRTTRDTFLSVIDTQIAPACVQVGDGQMLETSLGGKLDVPVKVTRRGDFQGEVKLVAETLPATIKPADLTIPANASEGKLAIAINNAQAKPGVWTFALESDLKLKLVRDPTAVAAAETDQKEVAEAVESVAAELKQATETRDAAAQEAAAAVQQAKKAQGNPQQLAEAQARASAADKAKNKAEAALKDVQARQQRAMAAKQAADKRVADQKTANAPKDLTLAVASTPVKLRILPAPYTLTAPAEPLAVKQGQANALTLGLAKRFGFDDKVELTVQPPPGVSGLSLKPAAVDKGQAEVRVELAAAANATEGQHTVTIRARSKFNNVNVEAAAEVVVKIEKAG
jgi:hypothetical protein